MDLSPTTTHAEGLWSRTLAFRDRAMEARYLIEALAARVDHDAMAHPTAMLVGPVFIMTHWSGLSWLGVALMMIGCGVIAPILTFLSQWRRPFYSKWRTPLVLTYAIYAMGTLCAVGSTEPPPDSNPAAMMSRFLARSPAMLSLFYCLNFSIPLRQQVVFQLSVLPWMVHWARQFCVLCTTPDDPAGRIFQNLGASIDRIAFIFLHPTNEGIKFRCTAAMTWISIMIGVVLPIVAVHSMEIFQRGNFAAKAFPHSMHYSIECSLSKSKEIGLWCFFLVSEFIWAACRITDDAFGGGH